MKFWQLAAFGWLLWTTAAHCAVAGEHASLADAVEKQETTAIDTLLQQHADVNTHQVDGMTALHWAVYHGNEHIVKRLITAGADVNAKNRYGVAPLSTACLNGNAGIIDLLLSAGADANATLRGGETALMTAARTGRIRPVQALLARGAEVNAKDRMSQTALMWAAADGHLEVVGALMESGADYRTPLKSGFTPLFFAVRQGHSDVVFALLEAGLDVNDSMQPKRSHREHKGVSPLLLAIENGHFELAAALLDAGADANDMRTGFSALHALTWIRKPNSGDDNGLPPPRGSGKLGGLDLVRKLVAHGANVNARLKKERSEPGQLNLAGATPFLMAADTADLPLMKLLVELGADPLLPNTDQCTPLMAAAGIGTLAPGEEAGTESEALEAAQYALELGGDINAIDENGETAMHGAAYKSLPKMVEFLANHGAKEEIWNRKNKHGWTPMLIARGYRPGNFKPSEETIAALKRIASSPDAIDSEPPPKPDAGY